VVTDAMVAADENLPDDRLGLAGRLAERRVVRRHVAPAEERLPLVADDLVHHALDGLPLARVGGQKDGADAVAAGRRQRDAEALALLLDEGVRDLEEDARAVAGVLLAAAGAAVLQVDEDLHGLADEVARFAPLEVHDEADAAGVVFVLRVVQALLGGTR